jgi:hypothetical protein
VGGNYPKNVFNEKKKSIEKERVTFNF